MELNIEEIGYRRIAAMALIAGILSVFYSFLMGINMVVSFLAMLLAVFGSYYVFMSFLKEEKPPELLEGESIILRTLDKGRLIFPRGIGKFLGRETQADLSIYLTNRRIIVNSRANGQVLSIPLPSIKNYGKEKKVMTNYIRLSYVDENGKDKDALMIVGNPDRWIHRMAELGVGMKPGGQTGSREETAKNSDSRDMKKIKKSIVE